MQLFKIKETVPSSSTMSWIVNAQKCPSAQARKKYTIKSPIEYGLSKMKLEYGRVGGGEDSESVIDVS